MHKRLLLSGFFSSVFLGLSLFVGSAHAALTTDYSTYVAPATVNFSNPGHGASGMAIYNMSASSSPACENDGAVGSSGNLWSSVCTGYSSTSTVATFDIITIYDAVCNGVSYATCYSNNPTSVSNNLYASFSVTASSSPSSSTSSYSGLDFVNTCEIDYNYSGGVVSSTVQHCYYPDRALYAISFLVFCLFLIAWIVHRWFK